MYHMSNKFLYKAFCIDPMENILASRQLRWLGKVACMDKLGVTECFRVKEQALISATEAAEMILRVDDIVRCAPRQRQQ